MMKKFENCRKANASRMNFRRTGPSSEVGVHERLRKKVEEISITQRDKSGNGEA